MKSTNRNLLLIILTSLQITCAFSQNSILEKRRGLYDFYLNSNLSENLSELKEIKTTSEFSRSFTTIKPHNLFQESVYVSLKYYDDKLWSVEYRFTSYTVIPSEEDKFGFTNFKILNRLKSMFGPFDEKDENHNYYWFSSESILVFREAYAQDRPPKIILTYSPTANYIFDVLKPSYDY
jgi:hypothetical protein